MPQFGDSAAISRREALRRAAAVAAVAAGAGRLVPAVAANDTAAAVEQAHTELWRRFIDAHGVMLDFTDLDGSVAIPTAEECRLGQPNALGWWTPIENGAFFNGLYLEAVLARWRHTQQAADAAKARRLAAGLVYLASVSTVPGFVARGVASDGRGHYPMGSNDQTLPWFYGLWRYLESGLPTAAERRTVVDKLLTTAEAIVALKWQMPAEAPFGRRGGFGGFTFESVPRLLFVTKLLHRVTDDAKWDTRYREALVQRGGPDQRTRLETCERGMVFEFGGRHSWISSCCVAALRALWELETDATLRAAYARGLQASATLALESLPLAAQFSNDDTSRFEPDWRRMNAMWRPQATEKDAQDIAQAQIREFGKLSPRRGKECYYVREAAFAAWIVTLAPDRAVLLQRAAEVERVLAHFDYAKQHYCQFFPVELAWWRLQAARG